MLVLVILCFSFSIKKSKKFTPPGTVQITETLFADEAEISNFSWLEYETWIKMAFGKRSKEHIAVLPDTLVWSVENEGGQVFASTYYRHPAFNDYPVVGVSYEQALAYCKWRSERVKQFAAYGFKKEFKLEYRLPTKAEWELISYNGVEVFNHNNRIECVKSSKDQIVYRNYYEAHCFINDTVMNINHTSPIKSYTKNIFGLYDMIGNVSEMVQEKGISKGGSWIHKLEDCRVGKDIIYSKPEAWLGFRCVCVLEP